MENVALSVFPKDITTMGYYIKVEPHFHNLQISSPVLDQAKPRSLLKSYTLAC